MFRRVLIGFTILLVGVGGPLFAWAQVDAGSSVYIPREYTVEDNLVAIGVPSLDVIGRVHGDVLVLAQDVTIKGEVMGDVLIAALNVKIEGAVHGDVRGATDSLTISGPIDGNVTVFASKFFLTKTGSIGASLALMADQAELLGQVNRHVDADVGHATINGVTYGDLRLHVRPRGDVTIGSQAQVAGQVRARAVAEENITIAPAAHVGSYLYVAPTPAERAGAATILFGLLARFFSLLVVAFIVTALVPKRVASLIADLRRDPLHRASLGFLVLVATPLAALLVALTVIGLPLAFMVLAAWAATLYLSQVLAALALGNFLWDRWQPKHNTLPHVPLLLGAAVFVVLTGLPFIGLPLRIVGLAWGLGGIVVWKRKELRK